MRNPLRAASRGDNVNSVVETLGEMPAGTIGFRISGRVDGADYRDVLIPGMRAAVDSGSVRALFVIEDYEGFNMDALKEDLKGGPPLAFGHRDAWKRVAVATDVEWMAKAFDLFRWLIPGEQKVVGLDAIDDAKGWIAEG
jgi:SpoIIAA-like